MRITITIETSDDEATTIETGPQGADALIEHVDHDSTPRLLGFTPRHTKPGGKMTDYAWPTAPLIRARWREHGSNSYDPSALYLRGKASGEYINNHLNRWYSPEDGEFVVITEYVEAAKLEKRLDQIRQLEKALRKKKAKLRSKNHTIKQLAYQRKLASDMLSPRALISHEDKNPDPMIAAHATIRHVKGSQLLPWLAIVTLPDGGQLTAAFGTHAQAVEWVANELNTQ
ncbi:hypothetical protein [Trueperella pyogenes]|uniref:hypothetical protein n=1 Tax=Trueperella pyogenes TaxID=1661 RepID=UPI0023DDD25E|nr:hypothetical protein [Trueperella pyogenes]